jgi:hypothetical protein
MALNFENFVLQRAPYVQQDLYEKQMRFDMDAVEHLNGKQHSVLLGTQRDRQALEDFQQFPCHVFYFTRRALAAHTSGASGSISDFAKSGSWCSHGCCFPEFFDGAALSFAATRMEVGSER